MTMRTVVRGLIGSTPTMTAAEDVLRATRGCRPDMHEPDEQGVAAHVAGRVFDNAGSPSELRVTFETERGIEFTVNLATLVALARVGAQALIDESGRGR